MSRKYPPKDVKLLYGKAGCRCAFKDCRQNLALEAVQDGNHAQIGEIAHIVAHSEGGPRYSPDYPEEKRDSYENWILLCPTCHSIIDTQIEKYDIETLRRIKNDHENWVNESLSNEVSEVTLTELKPILEGITTYEPKDTELDFTVIPPDEKIQKNNLSSSTKHMIAMGLAQAPIIKSYLVEIEQLMPNSIQRVIGAFHEKYSEYVADESNSSDDVFDLLLEFSCNGDSNMRIRAAGLALLSHLFETCEVFEK